MSETRSALAPEVEIINKAILLLSSLDQDHATTKNSEGYSGRDTQFGNSLAAQLSMGRNLTPQQLLAAFRMLQIYRAQLERNGIILPKSLPADLTAAQPRQGNNDISVRLIDDMLYVRAPYSTERVQRFKEIRQITRSPGWDAVRKEWVFRISALSDLVSYGIPIHPAIIERHNQLKQDGKLPVITPIDQVQPKADITVKPRQVTRVVDEALLRKAEEYMATLPRKPFAHQHDFVLEAVKAGGRMVCALDVGTGKTFASLITAKLYSDKFAAEIWVIAPISLHEGWRREAAAMGLKIRTISWAKIPAPPDFNYVLIADEAAAIQHMKTTYVKDENGKPVMGDDGKQKKKITPIRTAATLDLALNDKCKMFLALTGTPVPNGRPAGLFPMLKCCKHWLSLDKRAYEVTFCDAKATQWSKWDVNGKPSEKTLLQLYDLTRDVLFRRRKTECLDLPPLTRVMKPVEMSASAAATYNDTLDRLRDEWEKRVLNHEISGNNEALVTLGHLLHATSAAKVETSIETINELVSNKNFVIAAFQYKDSLDAVMRGINAEVGVITGDTPGPQRQPIVDSFQAGEIKVLFITTLAGGSGLNCQRGDYIFLHDRPWRPSDVEQVEGRSWRSGRTTPVFSLWPQANTVDIAVDTCLNAKHNNSSLIVDGVKSSGFALDLTINGTRTILPDFKESISEIAGDLVRTILGIKHSPLDSFDSEEDTDEDDAEDE